MGYRPLGRWCKWGAFGSVRVWEYEYRSRAESCGFCWVTICTNDIVCRGHHTIAPSAIPYQSLSEPERNRTGKGSIVPTERCICISQYPPNQHPPTQPPQNFLWMCENSVTSQWVIDGGGVVRLTQLYSFGIKLGKWLPKCAWNRMTNEKLEMGRWD